MNAPVHYGSVLRMEYNCNACRKTFEFSVVKKGDEFVCPHCNAKYELLKTLSGTEDAQAVAGSVYLILNETASVKPQGQSSAVKRKTGKSPAAASGVKPPEDNAQGAPKSASANRQKTAANPQVAKPADARTAANRPPAKAQTKTDEIVVKDPRIGRILLALSARVQEIIMPDVGNGAIAERTEAIVRLHRKVRSKTTWKTWLAIISPGALLLALLSLFILFSPTVEARNETILGLHLRYNDWRIWLFAILLSVVLGITGWFAFVLYRVIADRKPAARSNGTKTSTRAASAVPTPKD